MSQKCVILARGGGFPYGLGASREKTLLMGRLYASIGYDVHVLTEKYIVDDGMAGSFSTGGVQDGLHYYIAVVSERGASGLRKLWLNLVRLARMARYIAALGRQYGGHNVFLVFQHEPFLSLLLFQTLAWLVGIRLIVQFEEWPLAFTDDRRGPKWWLDNYYYCKVAPRFCHGAMCISEYLRDRIAEVNPAIPIFKLPVITDFAALDAIPPLPAAAESGASFAYCASIAYREVLMLIIEAFIHVLDRVEKEPTLTLILHGDRAQIAMLQQDYAAYNDQIMILSGLPYAELIGRLKRADALLIPLRPTDRDAARFPHKVGEYLATKRPVITTWHGEIPVYFTPQVNALIMQDYSVDALIEQMLFVVEHPDEARCIGAAGYALGRERFDLHVHAITLDAFMARLSTVPA